MLRFWFNGKSNQIYFKTYQYTLKEVLIFVFVEHAGSLNPMSPRNRNVATMKQIILRKCLTFFYKTEKLNLFGTWFKNATHRTKNLLRTEVCLS